MMRTALPFLLVAIMFSEAVAAQEPDNGLIPDVPMAPRFDNLAANANATGDARWWRAFDDPILDLLVETALAQNFTIAEASARLDRARAGVRAADGAGLPSVGIDADAGYNRLSLEDPQLGQIARLPGFERNRERYSATIGASWEIDLFGRLGARSREARANVLASAAGVNAARLAVASEIAERYVTLRLLQQRRIVAGARFDALTELARLSALRVERGVSPAIERDRLIAESGAAKAVIPALDAAIEDQFARIDVLVARPVGTSRVELGTLAGLPTARLIDLAAVPADILSRRPDVLAAEATLAARDAGVAAAQRDRLPRFNLAGLFGTIASAINPLFGAASLTAQGSGGVTYTAFDGGRSKAGVEGAKADLDGATSAYQRTVLSAIADVESAASARDSATARLAAFRESERRLESTLLAVRLGYEQGALALSDVLDVDRRLQDARDSRLIAEADEARGSIALVRALGGGAPEDANLGLAQQMGN